MNAAGQKRPHLDEKARATIQTRRANLAGVTLHRLKEDLGQEIYIAAWEVPSRRLGDGYGLRAFVAGAQAIAGVPP